MKTVVPFLAILAALHMVSSYALGGYPGTFYQIMLRLNKDRKSVRSAPSPNQLWAILDPPAALGSLSHEPISSNRIVRSADLRSHYPWQIEDPIPVLLEADGNLLEENNGDREEIDGNREEIDGNREEIDGDREEIDGDGEEIDGDREERQMYRTDMPTTDPPTVECGGEYNISIDPNNTTFPNDTVFLEDIETPGYGGEGYPENIRCEWTVNLEPQCKGGLILFHVLEGSIRETRACEGDYLRVKMSDAVSATTFCGKLVSGKYKATGIHLFTTAGNHHSKIVFESGSFSDGMLSAGDPVGFKFQLMLFCWVYSDEFLAMSTTTTTTTTTPAPVTTQPTLRLEGDDFISYEEENNPMAIDDVELSFGGDTGSDTNINTDELSFGGNTGSDAVVSVDEYKPSFGTDVGSDTIVIKPTVSYSQNPLIPQLYSTGAFLPADMYPDGVPQQLADIFPIQTPERLDGEGEEFVSPFNEIDATSIIRDLIAKSG